MAIVCGRPKISPAVFLLAILLVILAIVAIVWTTRRAPQQVVPAPSAQIELPLGWMPLQAHLSGPHGKFFPPGVLLNWSSSSPHHLSL